MLMDLPTDHIPDEPINFIYIQSFFEYFLIFNFEEGFL